MYRILVAVAALAIMAVAGGAAETNRVAIQNGLASVAIPEEWMAVEADEYHSVVISEKPDSACRLMLALPNPVLNANQLAAMEIAALSLAMGGHEIIEATIGPFKGRERMRVHFTAPLGDGRLVGLMQLMYYGDCVAMAVATGPDEKFDDFIADAVPIMESYELDENVMGQRSVELRLNAEKLREDTIREYLRSQSQPIVDREEFINDFINLVFPKGIKKTG